MAIPIEAGAVLHAYSEIKRRILDGRYPAGMKLSEVRLAAELGLGRSPIRSALARLKSEGWVAVSPQSGTYVRSPSAQEIADLFDLRLLLESHVTRLAAERIGEDELRRLNRAFAAVAPDFDEAHIEEFFALDTLLHTAIYRAAGNALAADILLNLRDKISWIRRASAGAMGRLRRSREELERILRALEARQPEAAAELMRQHIGNFADFRRGLPEEREAASTGLPGAAAAGRRDKAG
ncbi:MAG TPA: GntR family transcriptional regulator [Stellaceae bacterium]|nr:GntR family transcriptional regulator [Stellaceae bacterium]